MPSFCRNDTKDELARNLLDDHTMRILGRAHDPEKFYPGTLIRAFRRDRNRGSSPLPWTEIFEESLPAEIATEEYRPIRLRKSSRLTAEAAADLFSMLAAENSDTNALKAAFARAKDEDLRLVMAEPELRSVAEHKIDTSLATAKISRRGAYLWANDVTIYVVTKTVVARAAKFETRNTLTFNADLMASLAEAGAKASIAVKLLGESGTVVEFSRSKKPFVLAFSALEIVRDNRRFSTRGSKVDPGLKSMPVEYRRRNDLLSDNANEALFYELSDADP